MRTGDPENCAVPKISMNLLKSINFISGLYAFPRTQVHRRQSIDLGIGEKFLMLNASNSNLSDAADRLCIAIKMIEDSWNKSAGIQQDLDPDYELIQAWMWVPNLYQLIEQSFKFLLTHKGKDITRIHRLSEIFSDLDDEYQASLERVYIGYRELHDYLPQETLQSFLKQADQGGGYEVWRYFLREGFPSQESKIPSIHIGTMLEILLAVRHIISREVEPEWEWNLFRTIVPRIQESLFDEFESIAWKDHSQHGDSSGSSTSKVIATDKVKVCHALLFRNLTWAYGFVRSSPCIELNEENTRIMELICGRMIRDHRHDFVQYIRRVASGTMKPFDISNRDSLNR